MARPEHPARKTAADLASAGVSPAAIESTLRESFTVSNRTLSRIMSETQTELATLEASLRRLKLLAIRAEEEGNFSAAIAAHRAIKETLRELRLARNYSALDDGDNSIVF